MPNLYINMELRYCMITVQYSICTGILHGNVWYLHKKNEKKKLRRAKMPSALAKRSLTPSPQFFERHEMEFPVDSSTSWLITTVVVWHVTFVDQLRHPMFCRVLYKSSNRFMQRDQNSFHCWAKKHQMAATNLIHQQHHYLKQDAKTLRRLSLCTTQRGEIQMIGAVPDAG